MVKSSLSFQPVTPTNLSRKDLVRVSHIEADAWGRKEGLGTYAECSSCQKTFSKQDIYKGKIDPSIYMKTVDEIERITAGKHLCCPNCSGKLEPVFVEDENIRDVQERYSSGAMLVLMHEGEDIVGFMDGHISDFDTVFRRDLSYRYPESRKDEIADAIARKVGGLLPERMFSCSSMCTTEAHMDFMSIYGLLQSFFMNFPVKYEEELGISELNSGGNLDAIYRNLGSESLGISPGDQMLQTDSYESGLFIQRELGKTYKEAFSKPMRSSEPVKQFLRQRKQERLQAAA